MLDVRLRMARMAKRNAEILTLAQAAEYLSLHPQTVRYHVRVSKHLIGEKTKRGWQFKRGDLDLFRDIAPVGGRKPKFESEAAVRFADADERAKHAARLFDREHWTLEKIRAMLGYGDITSVSRLIHRGRALRKKS